MGLLVDRRGDRKKGELLEELRRTSVLSRREAGIHLDCMSKAKEEYSTLSRSSAAEELVTIADISFLCQLDGERSCAGCCDDFQKDREVLRRKYGRRRAAFVDMVKGEEDLPRYRQLMVEREPGDVSCRFLAFLDAQEKSVGCLLHPKSPANQGIDLRRYGKHGISRCRAYICAGLRTVRKGKLYEWRLLHHLHKASDDWYAYSRLFSPPVSYKYYAGLFEIYVRMAQ